MYLLQIHIDTCILIQNLYESLQLNKPLKIKAIKMFEEYYLARKK